MLQHIRKCVRTRKYIVNFVIITDKPGECPRPQNIFCLDQKNSCEKDHECPGYSKCCYNGCRKTCLQISVGMFPIFIYFCGFFLSHFLCFVIHIFANS